MPFDGRTVALKPVESLQAALIEREVPTVDFDVLDAHKAEQVRQHPKRDAGFVVTEARR